jgi:hypothetical protein
MANKLDDLFSPERLRRSWNQRESDRIEDSEPKAPEALQLDALAVFERMQRLIRQRYNIAQGGAMQVLLSELQELLLKRFSPAAENESAEAQRNALNTPIEELLITIEDLAEALEVQHITDQP